MRRLLLPSILLTASGHLFSSCGGPEGALVPLVARGGPNLVVPVGPALANPPLPEVPDSGEGYSFRFPERRPAIDYKLPIFNPDPAIDFKLPRYQPDPTIDYKIRVFRPDPAIDYKITVVNSGAGRPVPVTKPLDEELGRLARQPGPDDPPAPE